ncbi:MAG TPA: SatD family protein, partial [Arenicellales bacterium]|nr:SatD family protein [Arenicellales bacterium]
MARTEQYLALIGDLEDSRALAPRERAAAQQALKRVLGELEDSRDGGFASPPTITLGDEFQTVYRRADDLFLHIWRIQAALHPLALRFGMGRGAINTEINPERAIGMDGPAFHRARAALAHLKEAGGHFRLETGNPDSHVSKLINHSLELISHEMDGWQQRRLEILCRLKSGQKYDRISEALGISKSAFYKNVEAGALNTIIAIADTIVGLVE